MIRKMKAEDRDEVFAMMKVFYTSPAVYTNGSDSIFLNDFDACTTDNPYLEGYIFEKDGIICGYGMLAKSFSTEFGKCCIWIEDIYVKPECRHSGLGKEFFSFIFEKYKDYLFRLEAEHENKTALELYKKCGFEELPYIELKK